MQLNYWIGIPKEIGVGHETFQHLKGGIPKKGDYPQYWIVLDLGPYRTSLGAHLGYWLFRFRLRFNLNPGYPRLNRAFCR